MPLPPLIDDASAWQRLLRNLRVSIPVAFWSAALIAVNITQTASLVIKPFSSRAFRRVNRWCAGSWWRGCVIFSERINGQEIFI
jgi:hypothetical protein